MLGKKKVIVKLSLDFWDFLICQPSKTSASILTQIFLHLLTLQLCSLVPYYDTWWNKHGAEQVVSRELTAGKCTNSCRKKKYVGSYFTICTCFQQSVSVWTAQMELLRPSSAQYWCSVSQDYRTGFTNNMLGWLFYLLGLAASQESSPIAVTMKVDLWRAEKQTYFVV